MFTEPTSYLTEINDPKETCIGPPDTSSQSKQKQSGDGRPHGQLAHQRDDKEDHSPRYHSSRLPRKVDAVITSLYREGN